MTSSASPEFTQAAAKPAKQPPKRRRPYSLSIRLSDEEHAALKRKAGSRPLGAYVRQVVLGEQQAPRRKTRAKPSLDAVMLAKLLGMLGKAEQVNCLFLLLTAAEGERITLQEDERTALFDACAAVREVRTLLVGALGLRSGGTE